MKKNMGKIWVIGLVIGFIALLGYFTMDNAVTPMNVDGESMMPTLEDNQRVWVNQFAFSFSDADYDDIVVLIDREDNNHKIVKRIVGKPNDRIEYHDNVLFRNGEAVADIVLPENHEDAEAIAEPIVLEDDEYYVLGDNLSVSADSRVKGAFSSADLFGKVLFN